MLFATLTDEETGMYHWRLFGGKAKTAGPLSEPCGHLGEVGSYAASFSAYASYEERAHFTLLPTAFPMLRQNKGGVAWVTFWGYFGLLALTPSPPPERQHEEETEYCEN